MNEPKSLPELIDLAMTAQAVNSGRELERKAKEANFKLVHTTINEIRRGTYKSDPSNETIRAIGRLAGVSDEVAFAAAGRRVPGPPFASELPPGIDDLSPNERRAAIAVLRTLVAQRQELNRYENQSTQDTTSDPTPHGETGPGGTSITWHGKTPEQMTIEELREAAAVDTVWVEYIRTRKSLSQSNDWDF